jgi:hypothetical protein
MDLQGTKALVTGGSEGIGKAIAGWIAETSASESSHPWWRWSCPTSRRSIARTSSGRLILEVAPDGAPALRMLDEEANETVRFPDDS